jgi:serine/threonine protein kinase
MLITFNCPQCDRELEVDATEGGARVDCPACSSEVRAPIPRVGPGTTLGHFAIERKIGSGGMGEVFLARQLSMDRLVALKVLPQALTRKPGVVERFRHEVRMSARLEHPHVVTAFEAGEDFGYHYLAMSFVDGDDLRERLRRDGVIPEKESLTYVRHVADALSYAWNSYRMLHRDVKPSNIMVDHNGKARLMDLGISKSLAEGEDAELTVSGTLVGTPHYMSPEQASAGADVDCRADIYSLGASLYHILTGTTPFSGKTTTEVLRQIGLAPVKPVRELNPAVSEPCAKLVAKMMAANREQRHPAWESVITDIDRVLAGREPLLALGDSLAEASVGRPLTPSASRAVAAAAAGRLPPIAAGPSASAESTDSRTPPRIDMRQRRVRWRVRHALWRLGLVAGLVLLAAAAFAVLRRAASAQSRRDGVAARSGIRPPKAAPPLAQSSPPAPTPAPTPAPLPAVSDPPPAAPAPDALPESASVTTPEATARPPAVLDEAGERHLAVIMKRATDDMLSGRPDLAAETLQRAAREALLAPASSELYRAAAVAAEGQRERTLLVQSLTEDAGLGITLKTRAETLRLKVLRVEGDVVVALRLHPTGDTPMGPLRINLGELSSAEVLERLQRFAGKPVGDFVLALALLRAGQATPALVPISRLPSLLQASLRARALEGPPAPPPPVAVGRRSGPGP